MANPTLAASHGLLIVLFQPQCDWEFYSSEFYDILYEAYEFGYGYCAGAWCCYDGGNLGNWRENPEVLWCVVYT